MSTTRYYRPNSDTNKLQKELFEFASKGKLPQFKTLLSTLLKVTSPEDVLNSKDSKGSPLILAAQRGHLKIVSYILKNFIKDIDLEYSITIRSEFTGHEVAGATALWCASLGGHFDVVRELVEAGADINHPNDTNSTPLRAASYHNRVEVIVYLLSQGADISICNNVGQAPVMISVLRENEEALRSLVTNGKADLSQTTAAGIDSLHITIERESHKIFNLLISLGAKLIWPSPCPSPCYYNVPEVYQPPCHIFVAAKCHNEYAMDYLSKRAECTRECEVDMWLVRGIERIWDYPSQNVTEAWRKALELRENYGLAYPGLPPIDLYEEVQEIRMLNDVYNISQRRYLIQCVLISERVFGPLYCTSCDIKIKLVNHLFREGPDHHWKCCELLYQLLQAVVKRSWMPTQPSITEFNVLLQQVNNIVPAFSSEVMTMERFSKYVRCIYTRYDILLRGIGMQRKVNFDKCLNHLLTFLDVWLKKFEGLTSVESMVYRNPIFIEGLRIIFYPLVREEPIYHSILKSKHLLKYEHVLNAFISLSTPDMLEISNKDGLNALHFACKLETVPESVIHTLIQSGAHLDSVTPSNQTPIESCSKLSTQYLVLRSYYPLKLACLTAHTIVQYQLPTDTLPAYFHTFINLHRKPWQKFNE